MIDLPKYPGERVVANGNQLVCPHVEARLADGGIFYPITPSTEMGELFQQSFADGELNVFGRPKLAVEAEGEHAAQGGAIAYSVTGKRVVNFTSGQGITYGIEQYYHAPGKLSTMVVEVAARALTKHALNVHCGHDDFYAALDVGWIMLMARDAQQAADQALIIRRVTELSLTPGMNIQDGFLTSHLERTFLAPEAGLIREFLGAPDDIIDCPTEAQRELFGPSRRRVPEIMDLKTPVLLGPVQNQEHYMNGVIARRTSFCESILGFLEQAYREFAEFTHREYGFLTQYRCEDAETVFLSLGSAAENIEAAVDELREKRGASVGSIHLNVIRPFPEEAIVEALRGRKNVIIVERTDEPLATDNPMTRDVRTALSRAIERHASSLPGGPGLSPGETPRVFSGSYGLGSRDFRPEGILGAYEFVAEGRARQDGKTAADGVSFFVLGIDHAYAVISDETPSLLPERAIAVRLHSIGGWGMITTGKNLGAIIGEFANDLSARSGETDDHGRPKELLHVSANPKYGSEKKGSPTSYFLVVSRERIRVNCDLRHVNVVLCCDPKAFTHFNPLDGMAPGGAIVLESDETPEKVWTRIPPEYRRQMIEQKIRLFTLPGFEIARNATDRADLQIRMQGNAFLGAFFAVSSLLEDIGVDRETFEQTVRRQYVSKFGKLGDAVVESNMTVMTAGFDRVTEVPYGSLDALDDSQMLGNPRRPVNGDIKVNGGGGDGCGSGGGGGCQSAYPPFKRLSTFDAEFRAGLGYDQPASHLASVGVMAAASGRTSSKFVARRETPVFVAENCTQCMACITACPDTALPNTAQEVSTVLTTAIEHYVVDEADRTALLEAVPAIDASARERMNGVLADKNAERIPFPTIIRESLEAVDGVSAEGKAQLAAIVDELPMAYAGTSAIFRVPEKKANGTGGLFSIFVADLCKGCGECVTECGDHEALVMMPDSEEIHSRVETASTFLDLLPETNDRYLGKYDPMDPAGSRPATLKNHLMQRSKYRALVSGDGACAGCGEKSILHSVASITESMMRPVYHRKADRLDAKANELQGKGVERLASLAKRSPEEYALFRRTVAHVVMGLGGENDADTEARIADAGVPDDGAIIDAIVAVMKTDAYNHRDLKIFDEQMEGGMSVMAMGASTGCNTVYGSTPPNNPHPYPWMNSLFQDGPTISWMLGESVIANHTRRSVVPERLADALLERDEAVIDEDEHFTYTHFSDADMTDLEIRELPKVWCVGGDGALGDIGFQNLSKVILQNRPNVKVVMLDTQVYSNTGGQNSDSTPGPGGGDMNSIGAATQGKMSEKKSVAEIMTSGHGSPFIAQVSMADQISLYRAILDGLEYRGTAFFQCFTTCQPEHGVGDDLSTVQAVRIRDSRGMPEFTFNPQAGESYGEAMDVSRNPMKDRDWKDLSARDEEGLPRRWYTVAHWAATEARFRRHFKKVKPDAAKSMIRLDHMMLCLGQNDVVHRRFLLKNHRAYVPDFGVFAEIEQPDGSHQRFALSRQMVLFCVERRKAWRMLQSKAGQTNVDYPACRELLDRLETGGLTRDDVLARGREILEEIRTELAG